MTKKDADIEKLYACIYALNDEVRHHMSVIYSPQIVLSDAQQSYADTIAQARAFRGEGGDAVQDDVAALKKEAIVWHNCALVRGEHPTLSDVIDYLSSIGVLKAAATRKPVKLQFPTMLRKMWSGTEVQEWLDRRADQ